MSEENPVLPVRIWWWLEDKIPGFLAVERRFFWWLRGVQHPVERYYYLRKEWFPPKIGARVEDCRMEVHTVTAYGNTKDDLILDDGFRCSWMHCCDYPGER